MSLRISKLNSLSGSSSTENLWNKNRNNIYTLNKVTINKDFLDENYSLDISGSLKVKGNLLIDGESTIVKSSILEVDDPLINIGNNNYSSSKPVGFYSQYNKDSDPTKEVLYTGLIKPKKSNRYSIVDNDINKPDDLSGNILPSGDLSIKKLFINNDNPSNDKINLDVSGDVRLSSIQKNFDNSYDILIIKDDNIIYKQDIFTLNSNINNLYFININNHNLLENINITNNIKIYYFPFSNSLLPIEENLLTSNTLLNYGFLIPFESVLSAGFGYLKIGSALGNQNISIKIGLSKLNKDNSKSISNISNILQTFTEDIILNVSTNGSDIIKFDLPNSNIILNKGDLIFFKIIFYIGSYYISYPILNTTLILKPT